MKKSLSLLLALVLLLALAVPAYAADPARKVETKSGVTVMHAADWKEEFPSQYETWLQNSENDEIVDYLEEYPYLRTLYEGYGFAIDYGSARGHYYDVEDIEATGRPHPLANCWTCKTPDFTNMVNEEGIEAYKKDWTEVQAEVTEGISCYSCHANTPGEITVTHTYWIDALGDDFDSVAGANLACGQCHNEYYFEPETKATTIAHNSLESMAPETMLAFFNDGSNFSTGEPFADWTNPRTGVRMIKVQHPEFETFMGAGSQHAGTFTCADCHMAKQTAEDGTVTHSHYLTSPLDNEELIANTCSLCHNGSLQPELKDQVAAVQAEIEELTNAVGNQLADLTEKLAAAVETGEYTDEQLAEVRQLARDAQFYWDFVFVENAEGAHNSALSRDCLGKAESLCADAVSALEALTA
ncbi:MAG: ammonia-forming cytochrome c nitrite reductase subunit c552 [Oscillospiraceae bacterium]|nr:ammonia-forming cytochrome c nitrite reductase subunit c552 [Oscillospiraceae bacterium]